MIVFGSLGYPDPIFPNFSFNSSIRLSRRTFAIIEAADTGSLFSSALCSAIIFAFPFVFFLRFLENFSTFVLAASMKAFLTLRWFNILENPISSIWLRFVFRFCIEVIFWALNSMISTFSAVFLK